MNRQPAAGDHVRGFDDFLRGNAADRLRTCRRELGGIGGVFLEADAVVIHEFLIIESLGDEHVRDGQRQGTVRAGPGLQVQIGQCGMIVAQAGISGSSILGNGVILAGQAGLAGHLRIGDGAIVMAQAGISKDIAPGKIMFGTPAVERRDFAKQMLNISRIEKLNDTVKNLVKQVAELQDALAKANGKEEN